MNEKAMCITDVSQPTNATPGGNIAMADPITPQQRREDAAYCREKMERLRRRIDAVRGSDPLGVVIGGPLSVELYERLAHLSERAAALQEAVDALNAHQELEPVGFGGGGALIDVRVRHEKWNDARRALEYIRQDGERTSAAISAASGKRLTHRQMRDAEVE